MAEFLVLLAALYLCDARVEAHGHTRTEHTCAPQAQAVQTWFTGFDLAPEGSPDRAAQLAAAQAVFTAWEAANPDLVADMRAEAWLRARGLVTAMN